MERKNNLSNNLKIYRNIRTLTMSEFSNELGIPKSTLQSVMQDGNTTLDTAIRMSNAIGCSLDELVFDKVPHEAVDRARQILQEINWYAQLSKEEQEKIFAHTKEIFKVLTNESE